MLLGAQQTLADSIVIALSRERNLSAKDIQQRLATHHSRVSVQGIYRSLRQLLDDGVLVKEGQLYSLRISWILDIALLANGMEEHYLETSYLEALLPTTVGQKRQWYFSNLLRMNSFWSQVLIALAKTSPGHIFLDYSPHDWFELVQHEQENQFRRMFFQHIKKGFTVVGSRSFLDKYCVEELSSPQEKEEWYLADRSERVGTDPSVYVNVLGEYILTVKLDKATTLRIEKLFGSIQSIDDIDMTKIIEVFAQKVRAKMTIVRDPQKAQRYYRRFQRIFGPLSK